MNLTIDYGNSSAKVGIFNGHELQQKYVFTKTDELVQFVKNFSGDGCIISSVNQDAARVLSAVSVKKQYVLTPRLPLPIHIHYATPDTLGVDRIAAVCGARAAFPDVNCLVIDAGTCITYDYVDKNGQYWGGGISPGLNMRFRAMHEFTARLPSVHPIARPPLVGDSTQRCMQSGVVFGLLDEIDGVIGRYKEKFGDMKVILCGGDTPFFENQLKASIFASPELVLSGLNSILIYNVNY